MASITLDILDNQLRRVFGIRDVGLLELAIATIYSSHSGIFNEDHGSGVTLVVDQHPVDNVKRRLEWVYQQVVTDLE